MTIAPRSPRSLAFLCLASFGWAFSFGLGAPLASLWLRDAGASDTVIGLNTGVYYGGIALAAAAVPWLMRRYGRGCVVMGMAASGVTVALFPWGGSFAWWFLLRLLNGFAGALSLIPVETQVNHLAPPEQRSRDFGLYALSIALGMATGTLTGLQMYADAARLAFLLGGVMAVLAAVVVLFRLPMPQPSEEEKKEKTPLEFVRNFLGFGSAWAQGYLEGGMVALLPVYLLAVGLDEAGASWLMSGIMVGVIAFQVPVAWLADRFGRTTVLVGCYGTTLAALGVLPFSQGIVPLAAFLFLAGACSGAFYPLGLALIGERTPATGLARANAWYLAINCLGSLVGPVATGLAMDWLGRDAMFLAGGVAVAGVLGAWIGVRMAWRANRAHRIPAAAPGMACEKAA